MCCGGRCTPATWPVGTSPPCWIACCPTCLHPSCPLSRQKSCRSAQPPACHITALPWCMEKPNLGLGFTPYNPLFIVCRGQGMS